MQTQNRTERRQNQTPVQNERRQSTGNSTLASLPETTTTAAATAPAGNGQPVNFTGQYLYDRFIANDDDQVTKLDIVKQAIAQVDSASWKKNLADMVAIPKKQFDGAVKAAKAKGLDPEVDQTPEMLLWSSRLKTAQNHQNKMRNIYGAYRFRPDDMQTMLQGSSKNGYEATAQLATKVLTLAGIKWDAEKRVDIDERKRKALTKAQGDFLAEVRGSVVQKPNESMRDYNDRVLAAFDQKWPEKEKALRAEEIEKAAKNFISGKPEIALSIARRVVEMYEAQNAAKPANQEAAPL